MSPLKLLIVSDGRPGHEKQSLAIGQALADLTPVREAMVRVPPPSLKSVGLNLARYLKGTCPRGWPAADLVVGTGTGTHLPMLSYRRWYPSARVVTCMLPDPFLRKFFDLCCVPRHDNPPQFSNIFLTTGPPCLPAGGRRPKRSDRGLILVGGVDEKSHHWHTGTLVAQVETILSYCRDLDWVIATSPRTPADTAARLSALAGQAPAAGFFAAEDTPPGWIEQQYAESSRVWVTADSVSMLYEALSAGCSVGVLPVRWKKKNNKFQRGIDGLVNDGLVVPYESWVRGELPMPAGAGLDEAGRCAREILRRWWPARLG